MSDSSCTSTPHSHQSWGDFLRQRDDRRSTHAAAQLSEGSFQKIWDNEEDASTTIYELGELRRNIDPFPLSLP